ncbi:MAG: zinc ribbon domain-containing protein [Desulfovibrio sp.]|nr:zinc ribbon domain-containing protein [Desulfovibrio sp.]
MPIYEYRCPKCSTEFEELVFGAETPPCPRCGGKNAERLLSCACLHTPAPSRVGQTMTYPSSGGGGCSGCTASSCAGCK